MSNSWIEILETATVDLRFADEEPGNRLAAMQQALVLAWAAVKAVEPISAENALDYQRLAEALAANARELEGFTGHPVAGADVLSRQRGELSDGPAARAALQDVAEAISVALPGLVADRAGMAALHAALGYRWVTPPDR